MACDNVFHEGCSGSREVVTSLHKTHGDLAPGMAPTPVAGMGYPYIINPKMRWICSMSIVPGQPPELVLNSSDSPSPRDFAFTLHRIASWNVHLV